MMTIDNKFYYGDIVYLKTDAEQQARIAVQLLVNKDSILYKLSCGERDSYHYDFEISEEANVLHRLK